MGEVRVHFEGEIVTLIPGPNKTLDPGQSSTPGGFSVYNMNIFEIAGELVGDRPSAIRALVIDHKDFETLDFQVPDFMDQLLEVFSFVIGGQNDQNGS